MRKIFCLGFGCTGTTTLHATAQAAGLRCLHDRTWARLTRNVVFYTYAEGYNQPPPEGHPGVEGFCDWQSYDFFSDGHYSDFELLDKLFPGSYFILNTRSRYNWLTGMYNHLQRNRNNPDYTGNWRYEPTAELLFGRLQARLTYHPTVIEYFEKRDDFAIINVEEQPEQEVCEVLRTATGRPVERLHTHNVNKYSEQYEPNPKAVEEALKLCKIPENYWHLSLP